MFAWTGKYSIVEIFSSSICILLFRTMSHPDRADAVKVFQSDGKNSPMVMLLSLKVSSLLSQISSLSSLISLARPEVSD